MTILIIVAVVVLFVLTVVVKSILVIPQAQSAVIERLGRFRSVAEPGLNFLVPFLDRVRARIDRREQVVSFPPQPVITQDNLTVSIDTVVYFQVTNPRDAVYEISDYIVGVEQLTTTTLRNVVGGMSLEETLTSRDSINGQLRGVLDEATGRWGIRVARVELKAIDPPPSIQDSMEKQMRADREKRAMILTAEGTREAAIKTAEGQKQSQILSAEGAKQAAILASEGERQSRILRAQGERAARYLQAQGQAKAIEKVFDAIKAGRPTPEVLAYQYLQTLPQMAQGDANKVWMLPNDFGKALEGFAKALGAPGDDGVFRYEPPAYEPPDRRDDDDEEIASWFDTSTDPKVAEAVRAAEAVARQEVPSPLSTSSAPAALSRPPLPVGPPEPEPDRQTAVAPVRPVAPAYEPPGRADDDEDEIASWFDTSTDPEVAEAVRAAEAVARQEVPSPLSVGRPTTPAPLNAGTRPLTPQPANQPPPNQPAQLPPQAPQPIPQAAPQAPPQAQLVQQPPAQEQPRPPMGDQPPGAPPSPAPRPPAPGPQGRPVESTELSDDPPHRY